MKKRILYVGGFELPDKNAAANRVMAIAKAWRDSNIEVIFLGVSKSNREANVLKTKTNIQGFLSYSIPYPHNKNSWITYLTSIKEVKALITSLGEFDGVVCYNYQSIAFRKLSKYCKLNGIKIYADCTEWYNTNGSKLFFKTIKGFDTWYRMRIVQKKIDGVIVISDYLGKYYKASKNVVVIPPLVDSREDKWFCTAKFLGEQTNFIYAGNPGSKDRIDEIITSYCELLKKYKCKLWIIGISKEQFLQKNDKYSQNNIPESIVFLGKISHRETLSYLKGADCSLIIRDSNRTNNAGFPTKFVEAVTLGTGIIASNISDLEKYCNKLDNALIVNDSVYGAMENFVLNEISKNTFNNLFDYRKWSNELLSFLD